MNEQLLLRNIRNVLMRQEETILFALIERAQFKHNEIVYRTGALGPLVGTDNLVGYLLHETERLHAGMRRYTSPDEHAFYTDLPAPLLPALRFDESPLRPNAVNINPEIRAAYEHGVIPLICEAGDDQQYGSSAVCDVIGLQALSRRIHYGKFVAESKYRSDPAAFRPLIRARDEKALMARITDADVEAQVIRRVEQKARTYGQGLDAGGGGATIEAAVAARIYRDFVIPMNKKVQLLYLLGRSTD